MSGGAVIRYSGPAQDPEPKAVTHQPGYKPVIIGIYGVPGCGKSYLLNELKQELREESFTFYEGSVFQNFANHATIHPPIHLLAIKSPGKP